MNRKIAIFTLVFIFYFYLNNFFLVFSQTCNTCSPPSCTLTCNSGQTYRSEIPIDNNDYFSFTLPATRRITVKMTPEFSYTDYDIYTRWLATTCPSLSVYNCGDQLPAGEIETCTYTLTTGTYYVMVNHYGGTGGYYIELTCQTTTSTTSTTSTSTTSTTTTSTTTPTSTTSTTTTISVCGDRQINPPEQCDIGILLPDDPDNACESYEYCNSTCKCHNFKPEMLGCNFFDMCNAGPCDWNLPNVNCYSETVQSDPSYKSIIESLCQDASFRNHTWRQQCKF